VQICQTSLEPRKERKKTTCQTQRVLFLSFCGKKIKMLKDKTLPRLTTSYKKKDYNQRFNMFCAKNEKKKR